MEHDWTKLLGQQEEKKPDYFERLLVKLLFPLGGFLIGLIALLNGSKELPTWALAVLVAFVAGAAIALVWPVVQWGIARARARAKLSRAARLFYPEVEQTLRRLHEHLGESTTHTLVYELRDFASIRDKKGSQVIHSLAEATNINEWISHVGQKAKKRRPSDFVEVAKSTNLAAAQYRRLCEFLQNRFQGLINEGLLEEAHVRKLRNNWGTARDSYSTLMQDWAKACDKINHELGEYVGPAHFSPLRTLE